MSELLMVFGLGLIIGAVFGITFGYAARERRCRRSQCSYNAESWGPFGDVPRDHDWDKDRSWGGR